MTRTLHIDAAGGCPVEEIGGARDASYYPMTPGQCALAALLTARTGRFPRQSVMVVHADDALVVEIDRLVKLHLDEFRAALLQAVKGEATECEFHVLRPTLELRFQLPDGDASAAGSHGAEDAGRSQADQAGKASSK